MAALSCHSCGATTLDSSGTSMSQEYILPKEAVSGTLSRVHCFLVGGTPWNSVGNVDGFFNV